MGKFNKFKRPLGVTLGIFFTFFIFQNGTCNNNAIQNAQNRLTDAASNLPTPTPNPLTLHHDDSDGIIASAGQLMFTASGGTGLYSFHVTAGGGAISSVNSNSALYDADTAVGSVQIGVSDSNGATAYSNITVTAGASTPLAVTPSSATVAVNGSINFDASGGTAPYSFTFSGGGTVPSFVPATGAGTYKAPTNATTAVIKVTDAASTTVTATITVTTSAAALSATASPTTISTGTTSQITATGGQAPYFYAASGGGSVSTSGLYTAPANSTTATITVRDSASPQANTTVSITVTASSSPLRATASPTSISAGTTSQITATGGQGSYSYSVPSGGGSISSSGLYTAPAYSTTASITVRDSTTTVLVTITVTDPQPSNSDLNGSYLTKYSATASVTSPTGSMAGGVCTVQGMVFKMTLNKNPHEPAGTYRIEAISDNSADLSGTDVRFNFSSFAATATPVTISLFAQRSVNDNGFFEMAMKFKVISPAGKYQYQCLRMTPSVTVGTANTCTMKILSAKWAVEKLDTINSPCGLDVQ